MRCRSCRWGGSGGGDCGGWEARGLHSEEGLREDGDKRARVRQSPFLILAGIPEARPLGLLPVQEGAITQLAHGQVTCGVELGMLLIEVGAGVGVGAGAGAGTWGRGSRGVGRGDSE